MSSIFAGIMIPFIGTTAGAACVFFLKNALKRHEELIDQRGRYYKLYTGQFELE